ncbi:MAG: phenylacetate--CoA ligase family protein [Pedosphaera sp.]|nr:phenylacetate--CoA ligase family protein [Pedosphaera sp.]
MNVDWLSRLPGPLRATLYFGLQQGIGSKIFSKWKKLQAWQRFSAAELVQAIEKSLSHLLTAATSQSAYYRQLGLKRKPGESAQQFLKQFPILTREQIRTHFSDLVIDPLRREITSPESVAKNTYDWLVVKTGGTTGVPTTVVHDAEFRDWGRATRLFSQKLCGFPLGVRYFRLWGSEQDLLQQTEKLDRRVLKNLLGEVSMNSFRAKATELTHHLETIQSHRDIQHMMAYVDASVSLATFIEDRKLPRPKLKTIMACAGTVTQEWREILQRTFDAEVFDKYGSRECADIACECSSHTGLHVYSPNVFVEVVDEAGQPCPPGQMGRLLITLLNNVTFPMIRYHIGDMGIWAEPAACPCKLPFPKLQSLQGRADDMLTTEDGTLLSSVFIRHFVGVSLNRQLISEWQFEQTGRNIFVFRYIPLKKDGLESNLGQLQSSFQTALGKSATIQMQKVAEIPPSPTGKSRWIVNRWNK